MHDFYRRIQTIFEQAGSNRHQFCRKRGHNYQTLQAYWNSDKLPPGNLLEDLAREYNVSLDALVLGRSVQQDLPEQNPIVNRIIRFLKQQDDVNLLRIDGALQMFQYLLLSGSLPGSEDREGTPAANAGPLLAIIPDKTEQASELLGELARLIQKSSMNEKDKATSRALLHQIVLDIYQREGKDEWAELEEVP